jgi:hypothetical protein
VTHQKGPGSRRGLFVVNFGGAKRYDRHGLTETSLPGLTRQSIIFEENGCADQVRA